ncbi:MAG: hypothetical protein AAF585_05830, partial [Verrucomicrobiota bacterium]
SGYPLHPRLSISNRTYTFVRRSDSEVHGISYSIQYSQTPGSGWTANAPPGFVEFSSSLAPEAEGFELVTVTLPNEGLPDTLFMRLHLELE